MPPLSFPYSLSAGKTLRKTLITWPPAHPSPLYRRLMSSAGERERQAGFEGRPGPVQLRHQPGSAERLEHHPGRGRSKTVYANTGLDDSSRQRRSLKFKKKSSEAEGLIKKQRRSLSARLKSSRTAWTRSVRFVSSTVEVLWRDSVHRLARGPEGEGGPRPLLPGTLPELWAQRHQHVLEQGESATIQLFKGFTVLGRFICTVQDWLWIMC